jgi:hypothetical protein
MNSQELGTPECEATRSARVSKQLVGKKYGNTDVPVDRETEFGNPFYLKKDGGNYTRAGSVEEYEKWLARRIGEDSEFRDAVRELAGKKLGCWCQEIGECGPACHAEVLAVYALRLRELEGEE